MAMRFQNQSAPRFEQIMKEKDGREISLTMPPYEPREAAPTTVRITLRDAGPAIAPQTVTFDPKLHLARGYSEAYAKASSQEKEAVKALVAARLENPVESKTMQLGGKPYTISFAKTDIRWPFSPVEGHIMGIDSAGRDVLARIIYGFRISMSFGLLLTFFSMALGIAIGAVQGYYGGFIDISCQRVIEIWSSLPFLYVMILMGSIYGQSFLLLLIIYGIFNWIGISYYMRGEFFKLRNFQFVEAAKCLGVPTINILFKHIFPNALVPVITFFPFSLVGAIGSLAALDYLGFGMPQPTASWGELLNQAQQFRYAWWLIVLPQPGVVCCDAARGFYW